MPTKQLFEILILLAILADGEIKQLFSIITLPAI